MNMVMLTYYDAIGCLSTDGKRKGTTSRLLILVRDVQ